MIEPRVQLCFGAETPILYSVYRTKRAFTLGSWRQATETDCANAHRDNDGNPAHATKEMVHDALNSHAARSHGGVYFMDQSGYGTLDRLLPGFLVRGEHLHARFEGMTFVGLNRVCLDQDAGPSSGEWVDCADWFFPHRHGWLMPPINRFIDTKEGRLDLDRLRHKNEYGGTVHLYVPFASYDIDQCSLKMILHKALGVIGNIDFPEPSPTIIKGSQWAKPTIALTGPEVVKAGEGAVLTASVVDVNGVVQDDATAAVYLEAVSGYLPKTRVTVRGSATFKVMALGLEAGDTVRVKAGFRHFASAADLELPVI